MTRVEGVALVFIFSRLAVLTVMFGLWAHAADGASIELTTTTESVLLQPHALVIADPGKIYDPVTALAAFAALSSGTGLMTPAGGANKVDFVHGAVWVQYNFTNYDNPSSEWLLDFDDCVTPGLDVFILRDGAPLCCTLRADA